MGASSSTCLKKVVEAKHPRADVKEINFGLCDSSKHSDLDILENL